MSFTRQLKWKVYSSIKAPGYPRAFTLSVYHGFLKKSCYYMLTYVDQEHFLE